MKKLLLLEIPRYNTIKNGRLYQTGVTITLNHPNVYTFGEKQYEVIFISRGAFNDHHWAQFRLDDGSYHDYDDNNTVGGYTIPIEGFSEDNKMATIVLRRLT